MRVKVMLACTECKQRNYNTMKNKKNDLFTRKQNKERTKWLIKTQQRKEPALRNISSP